MVHLLHGNFGLPSDWEAALPSGVPAKCWHLWEIRRQHPETHTLTGFAAWFNNQIDALPPDPHRVLAGYSLGGRLALHVLADRPALWSHSLIISTHPGLTSQADRAARLAHDATWQHRCLTAPWPEVLDAWNAQPVLASTSAHSNPARLEGWVNEIAGAFDGWSLGHQENLLPTLIGNPHPCSWIAGADDPKFAALARTAHELLPQVSLQIIPRGAHRLLADHPSAIFAAITAALPQS